MEDPLPEIQTSHPRLKRREALRLAGVAGAAALVGPKIGGAPAAAQQSSTSPCVMTPALTEGPYFVDEKLNRADIRPDPATGAASAGVPLLLNLTVQRVRTASPRS